MRVRWQAVCSHDKQLAPQTLVPDQDDLLSRLLYAVHQATQQAHTYPGGVLLNKGSQLSTAQVGAGNTQQGLLHVGWRIKGWLPARVAAGEHVLQHDPQGEGVQQAVIDLVWFTQPGFDQLWGRVAQGGGCTLALICSMVVSLAALSAPCNMGMHASCMNSTIIA